MTHPTSHSESEKNLSRIIVVGGGPAGLVCARELVKRGWQNVSVIESSGRPGGRTHSLTLDNPDSLDGNGTTTVELGTQTIAFGKTLNELLKDTGLEAYLRNEPLGKARNPPDPKDYYPPFAPIPEQMSIPRRMLEITQFLNVVNRQHCLDIPGFRNLPGTGLSMPIEDWFDDHGFVYSKYFTMPFISTGLCGVDFHRVPVAYMVKLYKVMLQLPLWRSIIFMMRKLSVGNDQIWQRVAADLNVRYNQFVTEVGLSDGKITVHSKSGESYQCDKLIWAGRLPALGKALSNQFEQGSSPASQRHYPQVRYLRRAVMIYKIKGLPRNYLWVHPKNILHKSYGSPLITLNVKGSDWYAIFPWLTKEQQIDDVDRTVRSFVKQFGAEVITMVTDPIVWDYNPFFESDMIEKGVYDDIESAQGKDGIYVCGEVMSGVSLPAVTDYAKDLIDRFF